MPLCTHLALVSAPEINLAHAARKDFSLYAHVSHKPESAIPAAYLSSPPTYPHHLSILANTLTVLSTEQRPSGTQGECKGASGFARHG